jgi:hypothetical protein
VPKNFAESKLRREVESFEGQNLEIRTWRTNYEVPKLGSLKLWSVGLWGSGTWRTSASISSELSLSESNVKFDFFYSRKEFCKELLLRREWTNTSSFSNGFQMSLQRHYPFEETFQHPYWSFSKGQELCKVFSNISLSDVCLYKELKTWRKIKTLSAI